MSTIAPPPTKVPAEKRSAAAVPASARFLDQRIDEACRALWWAELIRSVLKLVIAALGIILAWVVVDQWVYSPGAIVRGGILLVVLAAGLWYGTRRVLPLLRSAIRPEYAARSLERDYPELRQALTSYVLLRDQHDVSNLQQRVVRSIGATTAGYLRGHDALPSEAAGTFRWWIGTAAALAVLATYFVASPKNSFLSAARLAAPLASIDPPRRVSIQDVQPGDTAAVAGRPIEVSARIEGLAEGELPRLQWSHHASHREAELRYDDDQRRYVGKLPLAHADRGMIPYSILAGDAVAGPFALRVQNVPVVAIESVHYQPPPYTRQAPWTAGGGAVSGLDGTSVKIVAKTNRPVTQGRVEFNPRRLGDIVRATAGEVAMQIQPGGTQLSVTFPLRSARGRSAAVELESYRIVVTDDTGQQNPEPIIYPIQIATDLAPDVAIMVPTQSPKELPVDAQQVVEVHASDPDFGLQQIALEIRSGIDLVAQPVLWSDPAGATGNRVAEYRLRPAELGLRVGDTVKVFAIATDNRKLEHDPGVDPNRSRTDAIELKIVASQPPPRADDPDADGVSAPDQRPPPDRNGEAPETGDQARGQQQGGGSGSQGQGDQQGETADSSGSPGGQSETNPESSDGKDSAGRGAGAGESSPDGDADQSTSDPSRSPDDSGDGGKPSDDAGPAGSAGPAEGTKPGQEAGADPGADDRQQTGSADGGEDAQSESRRSDNQDGNTVPSSENAADADRGSDGSTSRSAAQGQHDDSLSGPDRPADPGSQPEPGEGDSGQSRAGEASDTGSSGGQPSPSDQRQSAESPQHDGEAFERIREHIDQQRREPQDRQTHSGESAAQDSPDRGSTGAQRSPRTDAADAQGASQQPEPQQGQESGQQQGQDSGQQQGEDSGQQRGQAAEQSPPTDAAGERSIADQQDAGESRDSNPTGPADRSADGSAGATGGDESSGDPSPAGQSEGSSPTDPAGGSDSPAGTDADNSRTPADGNAAESRESNRASGTGGDGESLGGAAPQPPAAPNAEYARQATDMVLDYLEETRDNPDRELLEKLNWTQDDLKRFADRWQKLRSPAAPPDPARDRDLQEALKSLGMQPKSGASAGGSRESADTLRAVRDAGNRRPPPAPYRDAFDAFRRAVGGQ